MSVNCNSVNYFSPAKWVVSKVAGEGTHTTWTSALSSASSGDTIIIMPGSYTENPSGKAGVNICAFDCDAQTPNVILNGTFTAGYTGTVSLSGICFQTNSANCLVISGSNVTNLFLKNCFVSALNNMAISYSANNANVYLFNCNGDIATTGISYFTKTGAGKFKFFNCDFLNSGSSTTASTVSAAGLDLINTSFQNVPITSSAAQVNVDNSSIGNFTTSATGSLNAGTSQFGILTLAGTGISYAFLSLFSGSSSTAVTVGSGCVLNLFQCDVDSSNTNAISNAGTLNYGAVSFSNTSSTISNSGSLAPVAWPTVQGGTGRNSLTNHGLLIGAGVAAITQLPAGSAGQIVQSGGASSDPSYSTATYPSTASGTGTLLRADGTNWSATTSTYPNTNALNTLLYASSANVMAALPSANSGVLTTSSSGVPSITSTILAANGGGLVLIQSQTASNSASLTFTTGTSTYRNYKIIYNGIEPATAGDYFAMQISSDGGSTWKTSGYSSGTQQSAYNSSTITNSSITTGFLLNPQEVASSANTVANGEYNIYNTNIAANCWISGTFAYDSNGLSAFAFGYGGGTSGNTGANAFKFYCNTGNISIGTVSLYGIATV
jgi:hypothetical protein